MNFILSNFYILFFSSSSHNVIYVDISIIKFITNILINKQFKYLILYKSMATTSADATS